MAELVRAGEMNWDTNAGVAVGDQEQQQQVAGKRGQPGRGNNCGFGNNEDAGCSSDLGHGLHGDEAVAEVEALVGPDGCLSLLSAALDGRSTFLRSDEETGNL